MDNANAKLMWGNNPKTPINANNLSEAINFQSDGKFITLTNSSVDYINWADYTLNREWPLIQTWDLNTANDDGAIGSYLNKIIYNFYDSTARKPIINSTSGLQEWEYLNTPYNKILSIKENTRISASYEDLVLGTQTINFDFGIEKQNFTIDNLLSGDDITDFEVETKYFIYLYSQYTYNGSAYIKIIKAEDENKAYWTDTNDQISSPTGKNLVAYRKIGGFATDASNSIVENSIWDLYTYRDELVTNKINILDDGDIRPLAAQDFTIIDSQNLYSSAGQELTVEDALFQTRALVNSLNKRFYTNRKFGFNLQFANIIPNGLTLVPTAVNDITLRITPGFLDVGGSQIDFKDHIWFSDPEFGFYINDGTDLVYDAKLASEEGETKKVLYPGVWTVFVDVNYQFTLRHEEVENGSARWIPQYYGWFDTKYRRALGKFRVNNNDGNYIEMFSVTDTFEGQIPNNSLHTHYGTICPDGLLPCDGLWHDIYGVDRNSYAFDSLPLIADWGLSWYVETPNYVHTAIRGADPKFEGIASGPHSLVTNLGGADDNTMLGGGEEHVHNFPHEHAAGSLNVVASGVHPNHEIYFPGTTASVEVRSSIEDEERIKVSLYNHEHDITITAGDHSHSAETFSGQTESLKGSDADTAAAQSWPPYREALICIKKV